MKRISNGKWRFHGELGRRCDANIEHWLLRMPGANPGIVEMFHRRDRHLPYPEPVPWAGEFAGKYLISAVQACRMSDDPRLRPFIQAFVDQLVACQAENGYLGPWPKPQQLMGHWDLWGHYHCMLGLLMWYDDTSDPKAWDAVQRAAECICRAYVDSERTPIEAGAPPMNLSVLHIFAELYRRTGSPRYMSLITRIEKDLPKDGDWLLKGAAGTPYYQLPGSGPRWESLHIVQAFAPLFEATGKERYKNAMLSLWKSIRRFDRHPSGAFSTREGAMGTIYATGAIETCCSVAWMALTIDALRLTGDAAMADELELTLWNEALAAQHPSGDWWTYDTPLNGVRQPSYHAIRFQARPGTPELNCCSVNGPRMLGMLSEWAVMQRGAGLAVNFYGPATFDMPLPTGRRVRFTQETNYPADGRVRIKFDLEQSTRFPLYLRVPKWSKRTQVAINGAAAPAPPAPGTYFVLDREWKTNDHVELVFDMSPRYEVGQGPDRAGRAVFHVGPLLLAFDAYFNVAETADLKPIDVTKVRLAQVPVTMPRDIVHFSPMALWRIETDGGGSVRLCDFATAGVHGTDYVAWLPASHLPPPVPVLTYPPSDAVGAPGPVLFAWTAFDGPDQTAELLIAKDRDFRQAVVQIRDLRTSHLTISEKISAPGIYYWKVRTTNAYGVTDNRDGPRRFRVDTGAARPFFSLGEDGLMTASPLDGDGAPSRGVRDLQQAVAAASDHKGRARGALRFGPASCLRYALPFFPERDYSFTAWVCPRGLPADKGIQQIFSAWCRGMDDPLRVTLDGDALFARIEAGRGWGTQGVKVRNGEWNVVTAVKQGPTLTLYVNGTPGHSVTVPETVRSQSLLIGIGYNPLYSGGEHFIGDIDDFAFYARALTADEIDELVRR